MLNAVLGAILVIIVCIIVSFTKATEKRAEDAEPIDAVILVFLFLTLIWVGVNLIDRNYG